jgi:hypothetical protein
MSGYSVLCHAYRKAYSDYWDYKGACSNFVNDLFDGMLGWPSEKIQYIPTLNDPDPGTLYTPWGAMDLDNDGFFHLGVLLTVDPSGRHSTHVAHHVLLRLSVRKQDDTFIVKIDGFPDEFEIHEDTPKEIEAFHDSVFNRLKTLYEEGFIPTGKTKENTLGFQLPELPEEQSSQ